MGQLVLERNLFKVLLPYMGVATMLTMSAGPLEQPIALASLYEIKKSCLSCF